MTLHRTSLQQTGVGKAACPYPGYAQSLDTADPDCGSIDCLFFAIPPGRIVDQRDRTLRRNDSGVQVDLAATERPRTVASGTLR